MNKIIYPSPPRDKKLTIGVTAPSSGLGKSKFIERYELIVKQHISKNIKVIEGDCLRDELYIASDSPENRANDFLNLWFNPEINLIHPPWGGEALIDMLEFIDFKKLQNTDPKWVQGYSDTSTLLFALTIITGIATAHGTNFIDSINGQDKLTSNSRSYLSLKESDSFTQRSSDKWQRQFINFEDDLAAKFNLTEKTEWKSLCDTKEISFSGRIIGGCFDVMVPLIGTKYGDLPIFSNRFCKETGLILYFENCTCEPGDFYRFLYNMKYAGWFDHVNGVLFGRNNGPDLREDYTYLEALHHFFEPMDFPVIYDADIGHKPPQMTIINGSLATLNYNNGQATLVQEFV